MLISQAQVHNVPDIATLESNSYPEPLSYSDILARIVSPSTLNFVATENSNLLGYMLADIEPITGTIYIARITTDPMNKKKGVATALLEELEAISHTTKMPITLHVRVSNVPAIKLYVRNGYKLIRIIEHYYIDNGEAALLFKK